MNNFENKITVASSQLYPQKKYFVTKMWVVKIYPREECTYVRKRTIGKYQEWEGHYY